MSLLHASYFNDPWYTTDFSELERTFRKMQQEMGRTMNTVLNANRGGEAVARPFQPRINLHESEQEYIVTADVPGIPKEKVKVESHEDKLVISGEVENQWKEDKEDAAGRRILLSERRWGKFERVVPLPPNADKQNIRASMENGVLSLVLPKLPPGRGGSHVVTIS